MKWTRLAAIIRWFIVHRLRYSEHSNLTKRDWTFKINRLQAKASYRTYLVRKDQAQPYLQCNNVSTILITNKTWQLM